MSYSSNVKQEITQKIPVTNLECLAEISAIFENKANLVKEGIEIKMENSILAKRLYSLIKATSSLQFGIKYSITKKFTEHRIYVITLYKQKGLKEFLESFLNDDSFVIGAICSGPIFLAQAGLLKGKKYTDSLFVEMRESFAFIEENNFLPQSVVEDGNIITAVGNAFNEFAVHVARKLGYDCPDKILSGYTDSNDINDYIHHLPEDEILEFKEEFKKFF